LGKSDEEIAVYDDVVARFALRQEPGIAQQVAQALFNKGGTLGALGKSDEAIAVFQDIVKRFSTYKEPAIADIVAKITDILNQLPAK
jgi:TolA-binding protein